MPDYFNSPKASWEFRAVFVKHGGWVWKWLPGLASYIFQFLAQWHWARFSNVIWLSSSICKMRIPYFIELLWGEHIPISCLELCHVKSKHSIRMSYHYYANSRILPLLFPIPKHTFHTCPFAFPSPFRSQLKSQLPTGSPLWTPHSVPAKTRCPSLPTVMYSRLHSFMGVCSLIWHLLSYKFSKDSY